MKAVVKSVLFAGLGVCCLAVSSDAQQGPPGFVPTPAAATTLPAVANFQPPAASALMPAQGVGGMSYRYSYDPTDGQASQLARQIADAKSDDDKEKLKTKLKDLLVKQFDDRQGRHEKEIAALETQVKKLKEMVAKRQENKKDIIDERTRQLEREAKGLGW